MLGTVKIHTKKLSDVVTVHPMSGVERQDLLENLLTRLLAKIYRKASRAYDGDNIIKVNLSKPTHKPQMRQCDYTIGLWLAIELVYHIDIIVLQA